MKQFLAVAACCCGLLVLSLPVQAKDNIENITVTASRTPILVDDAGSAVTLITKQDIERQGALSLADLLRDVPGLSVSQQGGIGTFAQVRMRGAEANQVLVLIDGVEANDVSQGSEFNFTHVLATGIQRIEVVRGPQSALWGADALAGVINVITDPGAHAETSMHGTAETGSHNTARAALDMNWHGESGNLAFGASRFGTAGTNISRTGNEPDGYRNVTAHVSGHLDVLENSRLSFTLRGTNAKTDFDAIDLVHTGLPVDAPFYTNARQRYGRLALNTRITPNVEQIVSFGRTTTNNVNHTDAPQNDVSIGTKGSIHLVTNIAFGDNTASAVIEHERETFTQRGAITFYGDPNKDLASQTNSLAFEIRHQGARFDLSGSLRHDNNSAFLDANTWRLTGLWHVTPEAGLYASAGRGIKNPTFTDRFGYYNTFKGNPDLRPEDSLGWEVGLRQSVPVIDLELSADYFSSRLQNEINGFVFDAASGLFTAENVPSDSHRRGVELEASWNATESTSLRGSYTWLDATQPGPNGAEREVRRPRNAASIRLNYDAGNFNFDVGADYTGDQADDFFPPYPPYQERVRLAPFALVHIAAQYQLTPNITLTAHIANLLNKTYEEVYGFRAPGIEAYAGVNVSL